MSEGMDPSAAAPMNLEDRQANAIESFRARCIATGSASDESSLGTLDTIFLFHKRESFLMFKDMVRNFKFSQAVETIVYCPLRFVNRPEHRSRLSRQCELAGNYNARPYQTLLDYDGVVGLQQTDAFRQFANMSLTEARSEPLTYQDDTLNAVIAGLGEGPRRLASLTMVNVSVPTNLSRAVFEQLKHVRVIESTYNRFTDRDIAGPRVYGLALVCHAKMLESLQLRSNSLLMGDADILLAQRFVNLRYCRISGLKVSSAAAFAVFFLAHAETLEYLVLGNIYLASGTWQTFPTVLVGQMKRLKQMKLNALYQAGHDLPLEDWQTDEIIKDIVLSDGEEHGSLFMRWYPNIGPQDDYNDDYNDHGKVVW
ncbi:hypothetical protein D6C90_03330 [Aureobasidium pullulans]|uniref:Uncharacterized protein n=1 Tax=Aureobasidium pullulans TaxID=5580 RepID=A0A4S9IVH4_AURPU|nr:hypothetical protein D6D08_02421 [Aureobasidium pullulans]THZ49611.1 hypothetical protein D6C90_03330 [Aureobasidium pullulans]